MPGYLLTVGATVNCAHLPGLATPSQPNARVVAVGQPTLLQTAVWAVAGCALTGTPQPPCATAQWTSGAIRLKSTGAPLLLQDSNSTCSPTGTPLTIMQTQARVKGA